MLWLLWTLGIDGYGCRCDGCAVVVVVLWLLTTIHRNDSFFGRHTVVESCCVLVRIVGETIAVSSGHVHSVLDSSFILLVVQFAATSPGNTTAGKHNRGVGIFMSTGTIIHSNVSTRYVNHTNSLPLIQSQHHLLSSFIRWNHTTMPDIDSISDTSALDPTDIQHYNDANTNSNEQQQQQQQGSIRWLGRTSHGVVFATNLPRTKNCQYI